MKPTVNLPHGTHKGIDWLIKSSGVVGLNGYVRLPEGHPWLNLDYWKIGSSNPKAASLVGGARELTYADDDRWIGFDTAHSTDWWAPEYGYGTLPLNLTDYQVPWNLDLMVEQTKLWAELAHDAMEVA